MALINEDTSKASRAATVFFLLGHYRSNKLASKMTLCEDKAIQNITSLYTSLISAEEKYANLAKVAQGNVLPLLEALRTSYVRKTAVLNDHIDHYRSHSDEGNDDDDRIRRLSKAMAALNRNRPPRQVIKILEGDNGIHDISDRSILNALKDKYPISSSVESDMSDSIFHLASSIGTTLTPLSTQIDSIENIRLNRILLQLIKDKLDSIGKSIDSWNYADLLNVFTVGESEESNDHRFMDHFTQIIVHIQKGTFYRLGINHLLCVQKGIPFVKPDGGIRPIGILNILSRLAGALTANQQREQMAKELNDCDLGQGVKGGVEAIAHIIRCLLHADAAGFVVHIDV
jgi:hypothetical protein